MRAKEEGRKKQGAARSEPEVEGTGAKEPARATSGTRVHARCIGPLAVRSESAAILALTLAAAALRLWGVTWGMPSADSMFSFHPDEGVNLVNGVLDHGVVRPHLDIGFYNYGSLYFLLWQVAAAANSAYGLIALGPASAPNAPLAETVASLTLVGRLISVVAGAATVATLVVAVRSVWGFRAGIVAGALQAVAPLATVHSRFATVDATATLLCSLTLWAALCLVRRGLTRGLAMRLAGLGGVLAGLAGATRYNAILVVLAPICAAIMWRPDGEDRTTVREGKNPDASDRAAATPTRSAVAARACLVATVVAACLVGFLVGCPGAALNWDRFVSDMLFEARKSAVGMGLLFEGTGNGHLYHWTTSLRFALGWPLLLVSSAAALNAMRRRDPADIVLMAFVVPYFAMMGLAKVRFMRYMLPLLPVLFAWVGRSVASRGYGADGAPGNPTCVATGPSPLRRLWAAAVVGAGLAALGISAAFSMTMAGADARDIAAGYIRGSLPRGAAVAFATTPWYWSPPLLPEFTAPVPGKVRRSMLMEGTSPYVLRLPGADMEWDASVLDDPQPDAVVISDLESQDALRLRRPSAVEFLERLERDYDVRVFGSRPKLLGIPVVSARYLPVDLLYVCPQVRVYTRRTAATGGRAGNGAGVP